MPTFLVEVYASQQNKAVRAKFEARCRAAAEAASREGSTIRYVRSIFVPKDETCFYLFEGPSADAVREIGERAGLAPLRVVEAFDNSARARP
jgi:hypothetical protein